MADEDVRHKAFVKSMWGIVCTAVSILTTAVIGLSSTDLESSNFAAWTAGQVDWAFNGFDISIELNSYGTPCADGTETGGRVTGLRANLAAEVRYYSEETGTELKENRKRLEVKSRGVAALPTINWNWPKDCPTKKKYVVKMVVTQNDLASEYRKEKSFTFDLFGLLSSSNR